MFQPDDFWILLLLVTYPTVEQKKSKTYKEAAQNKPKVKMYLLILD